MTWLLKIEFETKKDLDEYVGLGFVDPEKFGENIIDMEFEELEED